MATKVKRKTIHDRNRERADAAWRRITAEREAVPHLAALWRGVCMRPLDAGPVAGLADCLLESDKPELVAQGEYFRRALAGIPVARPRLGHWIAELSDTSCVSQHSLHQHGTPAEYRFTTIKWALPWLRVFGLFPVTDLRCGDRRPRWATNRDLSEPEPALSGCNVWQRAEDHRRRAYRSNAPYCLSTHKHTLPHDVFRFLNRGLADRCEVSRVGFWTWDAAMMACGMALVDYARWANGLPPLYCLDPLGEAKPKDIPLFDEGGVA